MKIFVLADPDTYLAFALAGIDGRPIHSEADVSTILGTLNSKDIGLVLITEALAEKNRSTIDQLLLERGRPLILEIPNLYGPMREKPKITERIFALLRR